MNSSDSLDHLTAPSHRPFHEQPEFAADASSIPPKIVWSDEDFGMGIMLIDEQHKRLVQLINELHVAREAGRAPAEMVAIVEELCAYVRTHFVVEEEFMRLFHYPGYDRHRRAHSDFEDMVQRIWDQSSVPADLADVLTSWLLTHVAMSDQDLGRFLRSLGVR